MGTRAQVFMKDTGVYLYQHWDGDGLLGTVATAIHRKMRWGDPEYLARIIFEDMIKDSLGEETGFGIGTEQAGDIEFLVEVDCGNQTVRQTKYDGGGTKKSTSRAIPFSEC
jgi:hypothetical protein